MNKKKLSKANYRITLQPNFINDEKFARHIFGLLSQIIRVLDPKRRIGLMMAATGEKRKNKGN